MNEIQSGYANPNPLTEEVGETPFQTKREEIQRANAQGVEPPRCCVCNELIWNISPGQIVKYCGKVCKLTRSKKGRKKLLQAMKKNGLVKS